MVSFTFLSLPRITRCVSKISCLFYKLMLANKYELIHVIYKLLTGILSNFCRSNDYNIHIITKNLHGFFYTGVLGQSARRT